MRFADRLDRLPPFLFSELRQKISDLRRQGVDIITLGAGDPDMPTPEPVIKAAQRAMTDAVNHRYPDNHGKPEFRKAASEFMRDRFGVALDPETEIFPVLGGKEAIHHLAMICLMDGDVCLSPDPGYPVYRSAPVLAGATVHPLPLLSQNGFLPDLDKVPAEVLARARLIYINYPNNPTGAVAGEEFFARVVAFAKQNDLIVVHDNAYSELSFDDYRPGSFLATSGAREVGVGGILALQRMEHDRLACRLARRQPRDHQPLRALETQCRRRTFRRHTGGGHHRSNERERVSGDHVRGVSATARSHGGNAP